MKKIIIAAIVLLGTQISMAQYISPLNFKIYLAGNFGEIRSNHLHSGVDIKTGGVSGKPVVAVAGGYVSRISIGPGGFGKALYITHADGATSVYAHLDGFSKAIANYVRDEQYKRKSFAVELYPEKSKFAAKQGEVVAFSGNSGSSSAPHLHFEIRDARSQNPMNVISKGYLKGVADTIPPRFITLYVVEIDTISRVPIHTVTGIHPLKMVGGKYALQNGGTLKIARPCYFAVEVTDGKNGVSNTMGLYSLTQKIDNIHNFSFKMDYIAFATTRYVNTHLLYDAHKASKYDILRNYVAPNDKLPIYSGVVKRGVITLADTATHHVEMVIGDDAKNVATLGFDIVKTPAVISKETVNGTPVFWDGNFIYNVDKLAVGIPSGSLYESILLTIDKRKAPVPAYSPIYMIHNDMTPLQNAIHISITPDSIPRGRESKLVVASLSPTGQPLCQGGSYKNGRMILDTRSFGGYFVSIDTIPPSVTPMFKDGANLAADKGLNIKVSDSFSGIASLNAYIDGAWTLCDYDPKNNLLRHSFADGRYSKGANHTLRIEAEDAVGNKTVVSHKFFY